MAGQRFTSLSIGIWQWKPWTTLKTSDAKLLWLALYTAAPAKRLPPGLWCGGLSLMSEESGLGLDAVRDALDVLLEAEMIEFDQEARLLRLTCLPDGLERAHNASHIKGWWNSFRTLPSSPIRNAHVALLRWTIEQEPVTALMETAWETTFGTVKIPPSRKRGVRRLLNSDTSTEIQPSLFGPRQTSSVEEGDDLVRQGVDTVSDSFRSRLHPGQTDVWSQNPEWNNSNQSGHRVDTLSTPTGTGSGAGSGSQSFFLSSPESGACGAADLEHPAPPRHLAVVPPHPTLAEVVNTYTTGMPPQSITLTQDERARLQRTIDDAVGVGVGVADLALLREAIGAGAYTGLRGIWATRVAYFTRDMPLATAVDHSRRWKADQDDRKRAIADFAAVRANAGLP